MSGAGNIWDVLPTGPILPGITLLWLLPNKQVFSLYSIYLGIKACGTWCGSNNLIVGRDKRKRNALASQATRHQVGGVHETKRHRKKDSKKRQNDAVNGSFQ